MKFLPSSNRVSAPANSILLHMVHNKFYLLNYLPCILGKVSGIEKSSRRPRRMESYE